MFDLNELHDDYYTKTRKDRFITSPYIGDTSAGQGDCTRHLKFSRTVFKTKTLNLNSELRKPCTCNVHRLTFKSLCLQDLAAGLMLKLVILAQEVVAERAAEDAASCSTENIVNTTLKTKNNLNLMT